MADLFKPKVLIAEDDPVLVKLLRALLDEEGYTPLLLPEPTSERLREVVLAERPDCVLLDGAGPGTYGRSWDDALWMSRLPYRVAVIMLTGDSHAIDEFASASTERSQAAGFSAVIAKPFDLVDLLNALTRVVGPVRQRT